MEIYLLIDCMASEKRILIVLVDFAVEFLGAFGFMIRLFVFGFADDLFNVTKCILKRYVQCN